MRIMLSLDRDDLAKFPYALLCETRFGSRWGTTKRRRLWVERFTESERKAASKIFAQCHSWYLVKGLPDEIVMSAKTYDLWNRLADFCCEVC